MRIDPQLLCTVKFWARKESNNDNFVVDDLCFQHYFVSSWEHAKKYFIMLKGNFSSKYYFVPHTLRTWGYFSCCNPDCTGLGIPDVDLHINCLALLLDQNHCLCSHCLANSDNSNNQCSKCNFCPNSSAEDLIRILSSHHH